MHTLAITAAAALSTAAAADIVTFDFFLSGDQEVPPVDTPAVGAAELQYNTDTQTFSIDIMVFGIELADLLDVGPNNTPIHIHNAPAGANGPIVVDLGFMGSFVEDGLGIRFQLTDQPFGGQQGNVFSDPDDNELALFAAELYVNIHTNDHPTGELRGQIVPAPASTLALASLGLLSTRRRR